MTIKRMHPGTRYCSASEYQGLLFLSGQIADSLVQDVRDQTRQVLAKIDGLLAEAGTDKRKLLSVQIWLKNIDSFDEMNEVWDAWISKDTLPSRATVEARLASPDLLIEISAIAAV